MIRSLRTGVTGLKSHQVRMDVVGANIANVNTIAYKRGRAAFSELLGQELLGVGRTAGGSGINPSFVGLGVGISSIDQNWAQGSLENTNVATDLALNGDGFFITRSKSGRNLLSRAGNFTFNADGELVTASGLKVQGYAFDPLTGSLDMSGLQDIKVNWATQAPAKFTENVSVGGNLNSTAEPGELVTISSVIHDEQGQAHNTIIEFTKTATDNEWDYEVRYAGTLSPAPFATINGTVSFNVNGSIDTPTDLTIAWDANYVTGSPDISINLSNMTQFSSPSTATQRSQDGYESGQLVSFSIDPEGILSLNYTNGEQESIFQLAVGNVNNPNGMEQLGDNFYGLTASSGDLILGRAGREVQTAIVAGTLEQSNVDLATEFTDMIISQRGYQASARVITTSDELLQETVALKR